MQYYKISHHIINCLFHHITNTYLKEDAQVLNLLLYFLDEEVVKITSLVASLSMLSKTTKITSLSSFTSSSSGSQLLFLATSQVDVVVLLLRWLPCY